MRCRTPGLYPDTFEERLRRGRCVAGEIGQFVLHDSPLTQIHDPRDPEIYGAGLDFLWVAGDGNRPTIWQGAPLAPGDPDPLALTGVPVAEVAPYQIEGGVDVLCERHSGASFRNETTVDVDPAAGDDAVVVVFMRVQPDMVVANSPPFSTQSTADPQARGLTVLLRPDIMTAYFYVGGNAGVWSWITGPIVYGCLALLVGILDRDGNIIPVVNDTPGVPAAAPAGAVGSASGLSVGSFADGALPLISGAGVLAVAYAKGVGIADYWTAGGYAAVRLLRRQLAGVEPGYGDHPVFARASVGSSYDRNNRLWLYSSGLVRAGDSEGLLTEPTRVNHCYRNIAIPLGALAEQIGDDASTAVGINDAASLALSGLQDWGPNVCSYNNATGATRYVRCGAATATAVNRFALSIRGDVWGGANARIGWWDTAGPGWTDVGNAGDGYNRVTYPDLVPPAATCVACLAIPDGTYFAWICEQCEGSGSPNECTVTSPIPNWAAAATATRVIDDLVTAFTPVSLEGSVELVAEPQDWDTANTVVALWNTGVGTGILYADRATGTWRCDIDGTTTLDSGVAPVDGVGHHIRLRWKTGSGMSIEVRDEATMALLGRADGAYDGGLLGAGGAWELADGPLKISGMRYYRNGGS